MTSRLALNKKMRPFLLIAVLACLALPAAAQTPKTIVNCWIQGGKVNYGHLAELLPDSVTTDLLVDVRKKLNTKDGNLMLLWLEQQGWKLLAVDPQTTGINGNVSSYSIYILSKEIDLDAAARTLFLQKLENLSKK
jgi:hypothetical protein